MKQYNRIIVGVFCFWLLLATLSVLWIINNEEEKQSKEYLVEINRIEDLYTRQNSYYQIDLSKYRYVRQVEYYSVGRDNNMLKPEEDNVLPKDEEDILPKDKGDKGNTNDGNSTIIELENSEPNNHKPNNPDLNNPDPNKPDQNNQKQDNNLSQCLKDFFEGKGISSLEIATVPMGCSYRISPLQKDYVLQGYIRYAYIENTRNDTWKLIIYIEVLISLVFILILAGLFYIKIAILKPFHEISNLPYELSKGHLTKEIRETKNRYFGRFVWGLNLLRENLEEHKRKELKMEKDKKLMILSISHDIKTPLSTIKLYSRALYDNLYTSEDKKRETAKKMEEKADQIEQFVTDIIKTSSTDLFEYDIVMGDFYLSNLIEVIWHAYEEKLDLLKTEFIISAYSDKLLVGDKDKLIDVFDNLIQNAVKYGDGKKIYISFEEEDNCQLIRVTNSGQPMPSVHLHHMFESFWRGENAIGKPGNGLGLYICKQLLRKMEGDIYAEAQDNGMSIVIVLKKC